MIKIVNLGPGNKEQVSETTVFARVISAPAYFANPNF